MIGEEEKRGALGAEPPRKFSTSNPLLFIKNLTNGLLSITIVSEK